MSENLQDNKNIEKDRGEIERIKSMTKSNSNSNSNSNANSQLENPKPQKAFTNSGNNNLKNFIDKLTFSANNNFLRYAMVFFAYLIGVFVIIYTFDAFVIPAFVHSRASVVVPDVSGKMLNDGKTILTNSELNPVVSTEVYSSTLPKGYIIKQLPKSGLKVKSHRPIYLTISKGKETVKMPNLINTSLRDARVKLINMGLSIGVITYEFSETIMRDSIMNQSIPYKKEIPYGEIVNIVISKGSEINSSVPNLVGMDFKGIEEYITSFGFIVGSINYRKDETFAPGTIIEQFPLPNSVATNGTIINIVVNGSE